MDEIRLKPRRHVDVIGNNLRWKTQALRERQGLIAWRGKVPRTRRGVQEMASSETSVARLTVGVAKFGHHIGRGMVAGVATLTMVSIYAVSSIGSLGLGALGLTGVSSLVLASSAQPAQAERRRRRRRQRRGVVLSDEGLYLSIGPNRRRRRRRNR